MNFPRGCFPTMITPFLEDGSIDYPTTARLVNWYIASGCVGIFAVCLSSEMYHLGTEERLALLRFVHKEVAGRVCLVASGTFGGQKPDVTDEKPDSAEDSLAASAVLEEQARTCLAMAPHCDAVVVLTCQLAQQHESDQVWLRRAKKLLELTQDIKLGLYECPDPYKRVLSPEILKWAAGTGRFVFHKDTCCKSEEIREKIRAVKSVPDSPFRFYNANIATLSMSCEEGGDGFSGIAANFYPYLLVQMVSLILSEDYSSNSEKKEKVAQIQRFLCVAENAVADQYPVSAKLYLAEYGSSITPFSRKVKCTWQEEQLIRLKDLFNLQRDICRFTGVEEKRF